MLVLLHNQLLFPALQSGEFQRSHAIRDININKSDLRILYCIDRKQKELHAESKFQDTMFAKTSLITRWQF